MLTCGKVRRLKRVEFLVGVCMVFRSDSDLYWPTISRPLKRNKRCENTRRRPSFGLVHEITLPSKYQFHCNAHQRICFQKITLRSILHYTNKSLFPESVSTSYLAEQDKLTRSNIRYQREVTSVKRILFAHSVYHETTLYHTDPYLVYCWYTSKLISAQACRIVKIA